MKNNAEIRYRTVAADLLHGSGEYFYDPEDGLGRYEAFGREIRCNVSTRLPILTAKYVPWHKAFHELLWFISGSQRVDYLHEHGVHIWDTWADEHGVVGPLYGSMWREWLSARGSQQGPIDQLRNVVESLRTRPEARSHVISAWRPDYLPFQSIKPCHVYLQFFVDVHSRLSLQVTQRSCDWFLGVPFNLAQYAMLVHIMAHVTGHFPHELIWYGNDVHIYENHADQVDTMLNRQPMTPPQGGVRSTAPADIDEITFEDLWVGIYDHHGALPGKISAQGTPGKGLTFTG